MLKPRIKELIDRKGLKQVYVAEKIGVTPQQLNSWIKGKTHPRIDRAFQLAKVLECDIGELYMNDED